MYYSYLLLNVVMSTEKPYKTTVLQLLSGCGGSWNKTKLPWRKEIFILSISVVELNAFSSSAISGIEDVWSLAFLLLYYGLKEKVSS